MYLLQNLRSKYEILSKSLNNANFTIGTHFQIYLAFWDNVKNSNLLMLETLFIILYKSQMWDFAKNICTTNRISWTLSENTVFCIFVILSNFNKKINTIRWIFYFFKLYFYYISFCRMTPNYIICNFVDRPFLLVKTHTRTKKKILRYTFQINK